MYVNYIGSDCRIDHPNNYFGQPCPLRADPTASQVMCGAHSELEAVSEAVTPGDGVDLYRAGSRRTSRIGSCPKIGSRIGR